MTVWVVVVSHEYGTDVSVYDSELKATTYLASYCRNWWNDVAKDGNEEPPTDNTEAIRTYFKRHDSETAEIRNVEVE